MVKMALTRETNKNNLRKTNYYFWYSANGFDQDMKGQERHRGDGGKGGKDERNTRTRQARRDGERQSRLRGRVRRRGQVRGRVEWRRGRDNVYVAPGSVIRNGIKLSSNSFVGMGSVVVNDIPENITVIGNPAKPVNHNSDTNAIENSN